MSDWDDWGDWDDEDESGLFDSIREMWGNFAKKKPIMFPTDSIVSEPETENIIGQKFFLHLDPETCAVFNAANGKQFVDVEGGMVTLPEGFKPGKYTKRYVYTGAQITRMDFQRVKTSDDQNVGLKLGVVWSTNNPTGATRQDPVKLLKYYVEGEVKAYVELKRHDQIVNMAQIDFDVQGHSQKFVTDKALTAEQIADDLHKELLKIEAFRNSFNLVIVRIFDRIPDPQRAKLIREVRKELNEDAADLLLDLSDIEREKKVTISERTLLLETGQLELERRQIDRVLQLAEVIGQYEREKYLQSIEIMKIIVDRERNRQDYDQQRYMALIKEYSETLTGYSKIISQPNVNPQLAAEIKTAISETMDILLKPHPAEDSTPFHRRDIPNKLSPPEYPPHYDDAGGIPRYKPDADDLEDLDEFE